jgi:CHAT domain-containing protein
MRTLDRLRNGKVTYLFDGVLITSIFFLIWGQPWSLDDHERRCRATADPEEKEKVALEAVAFLVRQSVPAFIAYQVNQGVANEKLSLPADTLLFSDIDFSAVVNDSLAGQYEALLAQSLPKLLWMRRIQPKRLRGENFAAAGKIANQLDAWAKFSYWTPLMDFLEKAGDEEWHSWRAAAIAAVLSRDCCFDSQFEYAQAFAIYGLQRLAEMPDRRLYLDLCLRLQNPLAEGRDAAFNVAFALGEWIKKECLRAAYYLRVASVEFNLGNQFLLTGRYEEALEKLKGLLQFIDKWRYVPKIAWYKDYSWERIANASYEMGNLRAMLYYLGESGKVAESTRQKVLYHINQALVAKYRGDFQTADEELKTAVQMGKGDKQRGLAPDSINVWYAYLDWGDLYLEYKMPKQALFYYHQAWTYGQNIEDLLNPERRRKYWLHCAKAYVHQRNEALAKAALDSAKQPVDSPNLGVKNLLTVADLYENLGKINEAQQALNDARAICQKHGLVLEEINALLRQTALALRHNNNAASSEYPADELEALIAKVQNTGNKRQIVNAFALVVEAAGKAGQNAQASRYADLLLAETEALSRLYDEEKRLIFFQHSIYDNVKAAIKLDIQLHHLDSAFVKLDYIKGRAMRSRFMAARTTNGSTALLPYADIADLRKRLQPKEAILDYMVTEDTLYAFVLTSDTLQIFRTPANRSELQAQLDAYLNHLTGKEEQQRGYDEQNLKNEFSATIALSHDLYKTLLGGMAKILEKTDRLYIVPDEFLHALPFSTLALQDGFAPDFLVDSKATMYLPSASMFANASATPINFGQPGFWASIDPARHGAGQIKDFLAKLLNEQLSLHTEWENKAALTASFQNGYRAYFFYGHAKANWDDPWRSYIQFSLRSPQHDSLTYEEVDRFDWRQAELVVLAGCQTMGSRIYSGAGLSGLQRSFLAGGAKQVLATLWEVDAAKVVPQCSAFLQAWRLHGDAMLALQTMQKTAIADLKANPYLKYPHPWYWGAYNLTGAPAHKTQHGAALATR